MNLSWGQCEWPDIYSNSGREISLHLSAKFVQFLSRLEHGLADRILIVSTRTKLLTKSN